NDWECVRVAARHKNVDVIRWISNEFDIPREIIVVTILSIDFAEGEDLKELWEYLRCVTDSIVEQICFSRSWCEYLAGRSMSDATKTVLI
ncbi:MAG: hypothetical protein P1U53_14560, partial [Sulfitobacter sp.]|nr:hypothetical protein [Sulfitobacter sp.]